MEILSENLDIQVDVLKSQTPTQLVCVENEDLALSSEVVIDRPEFVEVEKRIVIKKNCIINEKYLIPKFTGSTIPVDQRQQISSIDASLFGREFSIPDSQGTDVMEIASQGSSESKMEICSQESLMEYSSQETDVPSEPVHETVFKNETSSDGKLQKVNDSSAYPDVSPTEINCYAEVSSTSDRPNVAEEEFPENEIYNSYVEEEISKDVQKYHYEKCLENEEDFTNEKQGISKVHHLKRPASTEKLLLAREEAISAREEACISREKALAKREAAIANQKAVLKECVDNVIPLPKRLKVKKVFEYS